MVASAQKSMFQVKTGWWCVCLVFEQSAWSIHDANVQIMSTDCDCCMKIGKTRCRLQSAARCSLQSIVFSVRQLVLQCCRDHRHGPNNDHHDDRGSFSPLINFQHNLCGISCQKITKSRLFRGLGQTHMYILVCILEWFEIYEFALGTAALINSNEHRRFGALGPMTCAPVSQYAYLPGKLTPRLVGSLKNGNQRDHSVTNSFTIWPTSANEGTGRIYYVITNYLKKSGSICFLLSNY